MKGIALSFVLVLGTAPGIADAAQAAKKDKDKPPTAAEQAQAQVGRVLSDQAKARLPDVPQAKALVGTTMAQFPTGKDIDGAAVKQELRNSAGQGAANALAAPLARTLGGAAPAEAPGFAAVLQQGLQQGVQQSVSAQLQVQAGIADADTTPSMQQGLRSAASGATASAARQQLSKAMQGSTKAPLAGDLLMLGLKRSGVAAPDTVGTFAPPADSALPVDSQALRAGVSIVGTASGQAGIGVKSKLDVGSQKVEISGAVDPNANSAQGASAGVQIKIGGN